MIEFSDIFCTIDDCIQQRGYRLSTPKPDLNEPGDNLFGYVRNGPPRKTISAVWNPDRGYFMIQFIYKGKIFDPGMFLIRLNELEDKKAIIDEMDSIFNYWNDEQVKTIEA